MILKKKIELLKDYVAKQAEVESFWRIPITTYEESLQKELRKMAFLIEEANNEQIILAIKKLTNEMNKNVN